MASSAGDAPPPASGGQFLLQLLQKPPHHSPQPQPSESPSIDPAVTALGPPISYSSETFYRQPQSSPWTHNQSPPQPHLLPFAPHIFYPQNPNPNYLSSSPPGFNQLTDDINRLGFSGVNPKPTSTHQYQQNLIIDRSHTENRNFSSSSNGNVGKIDGLYSSDRHIGNGQRFNGSDLKSQNPVDANRNLRGNVGGLKGGELDGCRGSNGLRKQQGYGGSHRAVAPPPGFVSKPCSGRNVEKLGNRWSSEQNQEKGKSNVGSVNYRETDSNGKGGGEGRSTNSNWKFNGQNDRALSNQLEVHGPHSGSRLNSISLNDFEESMMKLHAEEGQRSDKFESGTHQKIKDSGNLDDLEDQLACSLQIDEGSEGSNIKEKAKGSRDKDYRSDKRGQWILGQRIRIMKMQTACRMDIDRLNAPFLAIYKSLIPPEEEKQKQEKLLNMLGSLVKKEWPEAQLHVYGSCANSFGFSKSDIDICLVIQNIDINKSEILLKLAETLELNKLQNVQALTRARVPIVKLMDPDTGISCDVCINNILAVINTKLLHDYARIDGRLRQLAFIVKHWAKRRGVNETYQGTLSSYAYVLMCINFLQQRKPAILPCLQGMEATYSVIVENRECAYFNEVDKLYGFGARNGETIAQLVWAFFTYWAYCHDYTNDVISVRTGRTLSKQAKDWTRRVGNDRHLICIEDPFEITHDLGRVVDKASIRVLREEFERAADIMQHDSDPCTKLFEPYVPT